MYFVRVCARWKLESGFVIHMPLIIKYSNLEISKIGAVVFIATVKLSGIICRFESGKKYRFIEILKNFMSSTLNYFFPLPLIFF